MDSAYMIPANVMSDNSGKKKLIIIIFIVVILLVLPVIFILYNPSQNQSSTDILPTSETNNAPSIPLQATVTEEFQTIDNKKEVLSLVENVLVNIKEGQLQRVKGYFMKGIDYWQTEDAILAILRNMKTQFTDNSEFTASVTPEDIEVVGDTAQVLIRYTTIGDSLTARTDLQKTIFGWRITDISYRQKLDLVEIEKLKQQQSIIFEKAKVSENPTTFILPGGDSVEINKTLFTALRKADGAHEDINITVYRANNNYIVALYDLSRVVDYGYIIQDTPGTYFHAFDIRLLIDQKGGMLLFYPDTVEINPVQVGKPTGVILEIPVKIQLENQS